MEKQIITFIIDGKHKTAKYSIRELLDKTEEDILEEMDECTCQFNESVNYCECEPQYINSEITGYSIK